MTATRPILMICGDLCNLGDLALLLQNLELARRDGRKAYVRRWAALPDAIETQMAAAGGEPVDGKSAPRFVTLAARCDIVIGGGQLIRNNVSLPGLAILLAACLVARAAGGKVITRGLGVSRIDEPKRRFLWRRLLNLADRVHVRDEGSETNAACLVNARKVVRTADMAFLPSRLHDMVYAPPDGIRKVVIAPCIDKSEGRSIDGRGFPDLLAAMRLALPEAQIQFVSHDPRPGMDGHATDVLIAAHHLTDVARFDAYDLQALFHCYDAAALVVTNRLHAVIFSLLVGRPVLVVRDGTGKTDAMAQRFSLPTATMDGSSDFTEAIQRALNFDREARSAELAKAAYDAERNL